MAEGYESRAVAAEAIVHGVVVGVEYGADGGQCSVGFGYIEIVESEVGFGVSGRVDLGVAGVEGKKLPLGISQHIFGCGELGEDFGVSGGEG